MKRLLTTLLIVLLTATTQSFAAPPPPAVVISLHSEVDDFTRDALERKFAEARAMGAKTIILDMDTPGGLVTAGLDISRFIRRQDDLHVIAFISNKAYSAGAMIAVACNEIVMAPASVVGDCAPIVFNTSGELEAMPAAERAKAQSPIVNDFDASADRNGYDRLLLESMVIVERTVHWIQSPTGERKFVDDADYHKLTDAGWKPVAGVPDPLDGPQTLLTLQTDIAQKVGLAAAVSDSPQTLADQRGLKIIADLTPGVGENFVALLGSAAIRSLLLTIFMACLYIALSAPGHGAAEATAILALGLLLGVPLLTGYAQWWEVIAIFGGLALLAFEIFVFPGHGVSAVVGIILILAALLMTFVGKEPTGLPGTFPSLGQSWIDLRTGMIAIIAALISSLLLSMWLRQFLPKIPYFKHLILPPVSGTPDSASPNNSWPGVGTEGTALSDLRPAGKAQFADLVGETRTIPVTSETGYLPAGTKLVVQQSNGGRLVVVRPVSIVPDQRA
jgi:membrane-bound serine protease (ClpP class)